jgi:hypothetical protein
MCMTMQLAPSKASQWGEPWVALACPCAIELATSKCSAAPLVTGILALSEQLELPGAGKMTCCAHDSMQHCCSSAAPADLGGCQHKHMSVWRYVLSTLRQPQPESGGAQSKEKAGNSAEIPAKQCGNQWRCASSQQTRLDTQ